MAPDALTMPLTRQDESTSDHALLDETGQRAASEYILYPGTGADRYLKAQELTATHNPSVARSGREEGAKSSAGHRRASRRVTEANTRESASASASAGGGASEGANTKWGSGSGMQRAGERGARTGRDVPTAGESSGNQEGDWRSQQDLMTAFAKEVRRESGYVPARNPALDSTMTDLRSVVGDRTTRSGSSTPTMDPMQVDEYETQED